MARELGELRHGGARDPEKLADVATDGGDVLRLRADDRFRAIPVIVLSADGRLDKWRDELDAAACLAKPLELEPLLAAVSGVIANAAAS